MAREARAGDGKRTARHDPWIDVPVDHDPDPPPEKRDFAFGVGLDGYERDAGGDVAKRPRLKRPGETEPDAAPFSDRS